MWDGIQSFLWTVSYLQRSLCHARYLHHSHVSAGFASQSWHDSMISLCQEKTARMKKLLSLQLTFSNGSYYVMCRLDHLLIVNYQNIFTRSLCNQHIIQQFTLCTLTNIASWIENTQGHFISHLTSIFFLNRSLRQIK